MNVARWADALLRNLRYSGRAMIRRPGFSATAVITLAVCIVRILLLTLFALTALFLACLGLYGTLSYVVSLRRREVGLRLALGGLRSEIIRQLVGQSLRVIDLACLCGLALGAAFTRVLSGVLYGVSPSDPFTLAGVLGIVLARRIAGSPGPRRARQPDRADARSPRGVEPCDGGLSPSHLHWSLARAARNFLYPL